MTNVKCVTGQRITYSERLGPKQVFYSPTGVLKFPLILVPTSLFPVARQRTQAVISSSIEC